MRLMNGGSDESLSNRQFPWAAVVHGLFFVPLTAGLLVRVSFGRYWQKRWKRSRILNATSFGLVINVLALWLALQTGLSLSDQEKADLIEYLKSL